MEDKKKKITTTGTAASVAVEERPIKKLRCAEKDLKIILRYKKEEGDETVESKEFFVHSHGLLGLSKFMDASLSEMETNENAPEEMVFQDVSPEIFEHGFAFLEDPIAKNFFEAKDAVKFVKFYHKYEFPGGIKLCDDALADYFRYNLDEDASDPPGDLDFLVDAAALAFDYNLPTAKDCGINYIKSRLCGDIEDRYGPAMFSLDHFKKLHTLFKSGFFQDTGMFTKFMINQEEIESVLFPKYLASRLREKQGNIFQKAIQVTGTNSDADGLYFQSLESSFLGCGVFLREKLNLYWDGQPAKFIICASSDQNWTISAAHPDDVEDMNTVEMLWESPYSSNFGVPPTGPWFAVNLEAEEKNANPTVKVMNLAATNTEE